MTAQNPASRRSFLTLAGAGVAATGAAVALPKLISSNGGADLATAVKSLPANIENSIMAVVSNVHDGVVTIMVEGREVEIVDRDLVSKLAHAVRSTV